MNWMRPSVELQKLAARSLLQLSCLGMYYVQTLACLMCRLYPSLCADFSMAYVQILAWLMCRF